MRYITHVRFIFLLRFITESSLGFGDMMEVVMFLLVSLGYIPAYIAHRKGYDIGVWWALGTLALPIALVLALLLSDRCVTGD